MKGHYYDTRGASEYLSIPITTLETWRSRKLGPPYVKIGRSVMTKWSTVKNGLNKRFQNRSNYSRTDFKSGVGT